MGLEQYHHGARVIIVDDGAGRPIRTLETSTIGLIGTAPDADPAKFPLNRPVLIANNRATAATLGSAGTLPWSVDGILDQGGAVIAVVRVAEGADLDATMSNMVGGVASDGQFLGVHAFRAARPILGVRPRILIAPGYSHQIPNAAAKNPVIAEMEGLSERMRAHIIVDGPNTTDEDALAARSAYGQRQIYYCDAWVKEWSVSGGATVTRPGSARIAGLIAAVDENEDFATSPSNHLLKGVVGVGRDVDYEQGDVSCRANLLNEDKINVIIRDDGFRLWGNETASADPKYRFLCVSRTEDALADSIAYAHRWAVDRKIRRKFGETVAEKVNDYISDLTKVAIISGGECFISPNNSVNRIQNGQFIWRIRWSPVYPAQDVVFEVEMVDQWIAEVLK